LKKNNHFNIYMDFVNKKNQHTGAFKFSNKQGVKCKSGGGSRYGVNNSTLSDSANSGMGRGYPLIKSSNTCGGQANPSNLGAATIRGGGKPYSSFNNLRSSAYGYTSKGAALANTFRGSYAAPSEIRRSQCGGRRRRRKSRKKSHKRKSRRRKSRKRKSRKRKSRRRKSRRKKSRRKKSRRRKSRGRRTKRRKRQRGGNRWSQAGSNKALGYRYSSPNFNEPMPWALGGPGSKVVSPLTR
tara:strand:- start:12685 stop:13404 length:720 start_codon:yes stop_codon:yes gene_type:complete